MNGHVSLSDLNILMSFITRRTNLLSNMTIQLPGNINELSILMQFINSDMTWPSPASTSIRVELGHVANESWTCVSSMTSTPSLNGVVFDAMFLGNGSWTVRASNFSRSLINLGVVIVSQTTSSGSFFTNVMIESPFFGSFRFVPLRVINASKTSSVTSKVYGSGLTVSTAGMNSRFYIVSHDNFGFPRSSGGDLFSVTITGSHENSATFFIQDY